jgi:hypothetical protein
MITCPHCGQEFEPVKAKKPPPPKKPYNQGYLAEHLPLILRAFRRGISVDAIAAMIDANNWSGRAMIRYIGIRYNFIKRTPYVDLSEFYAARYEHAWLLRAEKMTLKEIGNRLGVSKERAREMVVHMGRRMSRAARKSHWIISESAGLK